MFGIRQGVLFQTLLLLLSLMVLLAPLPLASNRPFAWSALGLWVGFLLLLWGIGALMQPGFFKVSPSRVRWPFFGFMLLAAFLMIQNLTIVPESWHHPFWHEVLPGKDSQAALGLSPQEGIETLFRLLTYAGVFWLALNLARDRSAARVLFNLVLFTTALYSLYGLIAFAEAPGYVLWLEKWTYRDSLTSTFVNRNSYATFAAIGLVCALIALRHQVGKKLPRGLPLSRATLLFFSHLTWQTGMIAFVLLLNLLALLMTNSRGGNLAGLLGIVFVVAFWPRRDEAKTGIKVRFWLGGLVGGVAVIAAIVFGASFMDRLANLQGGYRTAAFGMAQDAIVDRPFLGHGLGAYRSVFMSYRGPEFGGGESSMVRAHNTYLELAIEIGLPATLLLMGILAWMLWHCLSSPYRRYRDTDLALTGVAVTLVVGFHALVDFSIQMPAAAVLYFLIMGVAVSQSWPYRHHGGRQNKEASLTEKARYEDPPGTCNRRSKAPPKAELPRV